MEESEIKKTKKVRLYNKPSEYYKSRSNNVRRKLENEKKLSKNNESVSIY